MRPHNRTSEEVEKAILADIEAGELSSRAIQRKYGVGHSAVDRIKGLAAANRDTKFTLLPGRHVGKVTTQVNAAGDIERHWIRHHDAGQSTEDIVEEITKLLEGFEPIRVTVPPPNIPTSTLSRSTRLQTPILA